jgi:hypothetical protein
MTFALVHDRENQKAAIHGRTLQQKQKSLKRHSIFRG